MKKVMLLKYALFPLVLNFASIVTVAHAGTTTTPPTSAPIIIPSIPTSTSPSVDSSNTTSSPPASIVASNIIPSPPAPTVAPNIIPSAPAAPIIVPNTTPSAPATPIIVPNTTPSSLAPIIIPSIATPSPVIVPPLTPIVTQTTIPSIINSPILSPIAPPSTFVPFVPITLPQIDFKPKSTTIQPLAAAYQLNSAQSTTTQSTSTQPSSTQSASTQTNSASQSNNSLASELEKANEELNTKYKKEYDNVVKDNIEILKEKERVLIQLHAQLKLQLEAQKFAAQQRARAIKEMQEKLKQEEEKSKKDAEEMKLNVQSIVDLSPLVLNINQPKEKDASHVTEFDFTNLKKAQKAAQKCKKSNTKNECSMHSKYCSWGRISKQKKHKCLFMCEKLSKDHCKKTSGCYFKKHKCRSK